MHIGLVVNVKHGQVYMVINTTNATVRPQKLTLPQPNGKSGSYRKSKKNFS